jgi:hypothetical protein
MKLSIFVLSLIIYLNPIWAQKPREKRHSLTPIIGLASNTSTLFTISPNNDVKIDYLSGDEIRLPITLRYQYKISNGNFAGIDILGNYNTLYMRPSYNTLSSGYVGPSVISHAGSMIGVNIHYSKTIDLKLFRVFGKFGLGGYRQNPDNTYTKDYNWYRNASPMFYDFAVAATNNTVRKFMPITTLCLGIRYKHIEFGLNHQYSLRSPVKSFEYQGIQYDNKLRFVSKGCFVGYRFEF